MVVSIGNLSSNPTKYSRRCETPSATSARASVNSAAGLASDRLESARPDSISPARTKASSADPASVPRSKSSEYNAFERFRTFSDSRFLRNTNRSQAPGSAAGLLRFEASPIIRAGNPKRTYRGNEMLSVQNTLCATMCKRLRLDLASGFGMMAYICATDPEDYIFSDIRGMICYAL